MDTRDFITRLTQASARCSQVLAGLRGFAAAETATLSTTTISKCYTVQEVPGRFDGHFWGRARKSDNRFWEPATSGAIITAQEQ